MRQPRSRRRFQPASLIAPMIDLIVLTLMMVLLRDPIFGARAEQLPVLRQASAAGAGESGPSGPVAVLAADGSARWQDQPVAVADLARQIARDTTDAQPVLLVIETDERGSGAIQALLDFQRDCGREAIGSRLRVLYRPAGATPLSRSQTP